MQAAFDSAPDGILIEKCEHVVYANEAYARLLGYRGSTELFGKPTTELVSDPDAARLAQFGRMRVSGRQVPSSYDFAARRSDGTSIRLQASVSIYCIEGSICILTIVRPYTADAESASRPSITGPHETLSPRERQVMEMLLAGKRPKEIACELHLTENTVATHRKRLLDKIGLADNIQLFQYALRHRLVDWT